MSLLAVILCTLHNLPSKDLCANVLQETKHYQMSSDAFTYNKLNYRKIANMLLPPKIFVDLRFHLSGTGT